MRLPIAIDMDVEPNDVSVSMDIEPNYIDSVSGIVESSAYSFKVSPHNGKYMMIDKIIGGTLEWNQLVKNGDFSASGDWVARLTDGFAIENDKGVITAVNTSNTNTIYQSLETRADHVYVVIYSAKKLSGTFKQVRFSLAYGFTEKAGFSRNMSLERETYSAILKPTESGNRILISIRNTITSGDQLELDNISIYDLTAMFGAEIAEYVLALETATTGAGVAWFKSLFPRHYYNYDAGTLRSVMASAHEVIGFNQWDEEWEIGTIDTSTGMNDTASGQIRAKNLTRVMQGVEYYIKAPSAVTAYWYDYNGEYIGYETLTENAVFTIPNEVCYMRFVMTASVYQSNICINVSGSRNGEYAGYKRRAYLLDGNTLFRGIPKLDQNNAIYYNGDEYCPSGKVKRKYGFVDIGTLNWYYLSTKSYFYAAVPLIKSGTENVKILGYTMKSSSTQAEDMVDFEFCVSNRLICLHNSSYENILQFKASVQGTYMVFELEKQSIEKAEPYKSYQLREPGGTEGFVDTRTPSIPVGIESVYDIE